MQLREDRVDDAVLKVRHPVEDLHGDDDGHRPHEHEARGEQQPHQRAQADEQERDEHPEHDREPDVHRREDHRPKQRVPEDRVGEDGSVVVEPDPGSGMSDQLEERVVLERELAEPVQRVPQNDADHDDDRRDQHVGNGAAGGTAPDTAPPPGRPQERPGGGGRAGPFGHQTYGWLSTEVMLSLADCAACLTESFPVRICWSMLRRMFPFSTSAQCFALGTNQLRAAARSLTLLPSRLVAFGMLPFTSSAFSLALLVKSASHSTACDFALLCDGIARVEPPRKPGIAFPLTWLGITNCFVAFVYFLPVQHVYQAGP